MSIPLLISPNGKAKCNSTNVHPCALYINAKAWKARWGLGRCLFWSRECGHFFVLLILSGASKSIASGQCFILDLGNA